jgi:outer membrane protein
MSKNVLALLSGLVFMTGVSAADLKIGVVDLRKLIDQSAQSQKSQADLKKEFQPKETKLVNEQKELKKLEEKLEKDAAVMSDADKRKTEKELIDRSRDFKREMDEMRQEYGMRANQEMAKIQKIIQDAIQTVAKDGNFDLILVDGVAFAKDGLNVTDLVEKHLAGGLKK